MSKVNNFTFFLGVTSNSNHSFHLHGHPFRVVEMEKVGNYTIVEDIKHIDIKGCIKRNLRIASTR